MGFWHVWIKGRLRTPTSSSEYSPMHRSAGVLQSAVYSSQNQRENRKHSADSVSPCSEPEMLPVWSYTWGRKIKINVAHSKKKKKLVWWTQRYLSVHFSSWKTLTNVFIINSFQGFTVANNVHIICYSKTLLLSLCLEEKSNYTDSPWSPANMMLH